MLGQLEERQGRTEAARQVFSLFSCWHCRLLDHCALSVARLYLGAGRAAAGQGSVCGAAVLWLLVCRGSVAGIMPLISCGFVVCWGFLSVSVPAAGSSGHCWAGINVWHPASCTGRPCFGKWKGVTAGVMLSCPGIASSPDMSGTRRSLAQLHSSAAGMPLPCKCGSLQCRCAAVHLVQHAWHPLPQHTHPGQA